MTIENIVLKAWIHARRTRNITTDFIFHSDRGVQYASNKMATIFYFNNRITPSMSRKGTCWDNADAKSFFKTIKYESLYRFEFKSYLQLFDEVKRYTIWYNTKRIHFSLDYPTTLEMELKLIGIMNKAV